MEKDGAYIAVVGPAGVGKGTAFNQIVADNSLANILAKSTTRDSRDGEIDYSYIKASLGVTDPFVVAQEVSRLTHLNPGIDTVSAIPEEDFLSLEEQGEMVLVHSPFGLEGAKYGYMQSELTNGHGKLNLLEPNAEFQLEQIKQVIGARLLIFGLVASRAYLRHNLLTRNTDTTEQIALRLDAGDRVIQKLLEAKAGGVIDRLIKLDFKNRSRFPRLMSRYAGHVITKNFGAANG